MKMKILSVCSIAALVALLGAFIAVPASVSAQPADDKDTDTDITNVSDIQVTGTTDDGGTFAGTFSINEFVAGDAGELLAVGTLTGEVTDAVSGAVEQITEDSVMIPVTSEGLGGEGDFCGDLSVSLGPADIDLSTPDDDVPDDGTSDGDTSDDGTPDDGTSEDDTPDDGVPEDGTQDDDATDDSENDDSAVEAEANLHLDAVTLNVSADSGGVGAVVGDVLCNLSGLFGDELDSASIATLLNLTLQLS